MESLPASFGYSDIGALFCTTECSVLILMQIKTQRLIKAPLRACNVVCERLPPRTIYPNFNSIQRISQPL